MANLTLASEYNTWYSQLNQVRSKHGASRIAVNTVYKNNANLSSQMTTLQNSINVVKTTTDYHMSNASINTTIPYISRGQKVLLSTKTSINSIISQMLNVCHHNASYNATYDSSDDSDTCDCSSYYSGCNSDDRSHQSARMHGDDGPCDYSN